MGCVCMHYTLYVMSHHSAPQILGVRAGNLVTMATKCLLNGSQKSEDKTMNRENGQEATLFEKCLTVIYRDTRGS